MHCTCWKNNPPRESSDKIKVSQPYECPIHKYETEVRPKWKKETVRVSPIDQLVKIFDAIGFEYELEELTSVRGDGRFDQSNDGYHRIKFYPIRRLSIVREKGEFHLQEKITRSHSPNANDVIICNEVKNKKEGEREKLEVYVDCTYDSWNKKCDKCS